MNMNDIIRSLTESISEFYQENANAQIFILNGLSNLNEKNEEKLTCSYIFKKGKNFNKRCDEEAKYNGYCIKHKKKETEYKDSIEDFDTTCKICLFNKISIMFQPCNHIVSCVNCSNNTLLKKCPICRNEIKKKQKVFF